MLTVYGDLDSGNVYKVRLALAQLGIAYRRIDTTQNRGDTRTAAFHAINPIGKIPAVVFDDGRALSESGAILFHLAQVYRDHGTPLFPIDPWDQANALRWMFFEQYSHEPYVAVNRHWKLHLSAAEQAARADRIADNHARGNHALAVMEQHLAGHDWLAGEEYSVADIALYAYTHSAGDGGFDLAFYPAIIGWLARVRERPGHIGQFEEGSAVSVVRWPG